MGQGQTTKTYDLSARDAAERLDVCPETVKRWARLGRVPARKNMSGYWMFSEADLADLPVGAVVEQVA